MISLYVAITAHGFGHATRTAAVINQLIKLNPEILPIFVTSVPRWLLEKYVSGHFLHRPRRLDVGVIQSDSLNMDLDVTLQALQDLQQRAPQLIAAEADFIRLNRIRLIYADVPPLATAIAQAARIPCWMAANFGWDFIYQGFGSEFQPMVDWIRELYGQCDRLFQLPMHEPMAAFPFRERVGLTGGDPRLDPGQVRDQLGLDPAKPTVLLTFGGLGIADFAYQPLQDYPDWQFITFDAEAPVKPNLLKVDGKVWRPVDIMPVCSQIISKPGYGTFAEAMRIQIPINCLERQGFSEAPLLMAGLRRYSQHRILTAETFFRETWNFLQDPWVYPVDFESLDTQGNQTIAKAVHQFLDTD